MNFKKKFVRFLTLSTLFTLSWVTIASAQIGSINGNNVNIRSEANTNSDIIIKYNNGQAVKIIGQEGKFFKINVEGTTLYVSSEFVDVLKVDGVVNDAGVNVRTQPSTDSEIIGKANLGDELVIIGNTSQWLKIEYNGEIAYISSDFVEGSLIGALSDTAAPEMPVVKSQPVIETPAVEAPVAEIPVAVADEYVQLDLTAKADLNDSVYALVTSNTSLRLRSEPSTEAGIVTLVPSGEAVDVIDFDDSWTKVSYSGMEGFLSNEFVEFGYGEKPVNTKSVGQQMVEYGKQFLGTPYVWAGTNLNTGVDCSGFVYSVYKHFGVSVNRSSSSMVSNGTKVDKGNLVVGDLVFFDTTGGNDGGISHVGIYMGDGNFIHSSSSKRTWGVTISSLSEEYYIRTYVTACRVL